MHDRERVPALSSQGGRTQRGQRGNVHPWQQRLRARVVVEVHQGRRRGPHVRPTVMTCAYQWRNACALEVFVALLLSSTASPPDTSCLHQPAIRCLNPLLEPPTDAGSLDSSSSHRAAAWAVQACITRKLKPGATPAPRSIRWDDAADVSPKDVSPQHRNVPAHEHRPPTQ
jgi:hypothetical protein